VGAGVLVGVGAGSVGVAACDVASNDVLVINNASNTSVIKHGLIHIFLYILWDIRTLYSSLLSMRF